MPSSKARLLPDVRGQDIGHQGLGDAPDGARCSTDEGLLVGVVRGLLGLAEGVDEGVNGFAVGSESSCAESAFGER